MPEKVIHVFSDIRKRNQKETWKAFKTIDGEFDVEHIHAVERNDYSNALKRYWGKGHNLIIVEQDIVATPNHIRELLSCKARLCCFPYLIKSDDPARYSIFNFTRYSKPDNWKTFDGARYIDRVNIDKRPKYCGLSGFGLTKIGVKAQELLDFPKMYKLNRWDIIDSWLSLRLYEIIKCNRIYHIHYPSVKHNHFTSKTQQRSRENSKILVF